jgi:SAM-dependent methyltransferase
LGDARATHCTMFDARDDARLNDRAARVLDGRPGLSRNNVDLCGGLVGVSAGARVIDLGCGTGSGTRALGRRVGASGHVVGVDPDAALLMRAAGGTAWPQLSWKQAHGDRTGEASAAFDVCWIDRVLAHCGEPERVVAEAARLLRPGGRLFSCEIDYSGIDLPQAGPALGLVLKAYRTALPSPAIARSLPALLEPAFPGASFHRQAVTLSLNTRRELWAGLALGLWLRSRPAAERLPASTLHGAARELAGLERRGDLSAQVTVHWTLVWASRGG